MIKKMLEQLAPHLTVLEHKILDFALDPDNTVLLVEIKSTAQTICLLSQDCRAGGQECGLDDFDALLALLLGCLEILENHPQLREMQNTDLLVECLETLKIYCNSLQEGHAQRLDLQNLQDGYATLQSQIAPPVATAPANNTVTKIPIPDNVDLELLEDFKQEMSEQIRKLLACLGRLQNTPGDEQLLRDMAGIAHSIKGSANYLGLVHIASLSLALESLLKRLRQQPALLSQTLVTAIDHALAFLEKLIAEVIACGWSVTSANEVVEALKQAESPPAAVPVAVQPAPKAMEPQPVPMASQVEATLAVDHEILESFQEESGEHIETIEMALLALEKNPQKLELVHQIFGAMHSIKGGANYLGLAQLANVAHGLESLLAKLRQKELLVQEPVIDLLLRGVDICKKLVHEIIQEGREKSSSREFVQYLEQAVTTLLQANQGRTPAVVQPMSVQDLALFSQEALAYLADIESVYQKLLAGDYQLNLYEELFYSLTNLKGLANRFNLAASNQLADGMASLITMLMAGEIELFPRIREMLADAIGCLADSIADPKKTQITTNAMLLLQKIRDLLKLRRELLQNERLSNLEKPVIEFCEKFLQILDNARIPNPQARITQLKECCEAIGQTLLAQKDEYHWQAMQWLLQELDKLQDARAIRPDDRAKLIATIHEVEDLLLHIRSQTFADHRAARLDLPIAERLLLIPGITETRAQAILQQYQSEQALQQATVQGLMQIEGIHPVLAKRIIHEFAGNEEVSEAEQNYVALLTQAIEQRTGISDYDYDAELITIFVDNARHILYKMVRLLFTVVPNNPGYFGEQMQLLTAALQASCNYMHYPVLLQKAEQLTTILSQRSTWDEESATPLKHLYLEMANLLPRKTKEYDTTKTKLTIAQPLPVPAVMPAAVVTPPATVVEAVKAQQAAAGAAQAAQEQEELVKIFVENAEEDIRSLRDLIRQVGDHPGNITPLRQVQEIVKSQVDMARQLNFQDLSFLLMREVGSLDKALASGQLSELETNLLHETIHNFADFINELKGIEMEPTSATAFPQAIPLEPQLTTLASTSPASPPSPMPRQPIPERPDIPDIPDLMPSPMAAPAATAASQEIQEPDAASKESNAVVEADSQTQTLRIKSNKVDELMSRSGDLVINRNTLELIHSRLKDLYGYVLGCLPADEVISRDFKNLLGDIDSCVSTQQRIIGELQQDVMKLRMVPMDVLFKRLPRLVREVAKQTSKMVKLEIYGETTELDKIVMEQLTDPIVHIIRNMIDHGIESSEERRKKNKPAYGTIEISALHKGNEVILQLVDDGRGIDIEKIRQRAIENGLVSVQNAPQLTKPELLNLLYRPGFSLKSGQVSATSGRGVGMNVVKTNITKIGGTIEIETEPDAYTGFIIKIPLTLAVIQALLVKIAAETYCIPIYSVQEVLKVNDKAIHEVEGQLVVRIRDEIVPLLSMRKLLQLPHPETEKMEYMIVIRTDQKKYALLVDTFLRSQEVVIKKMDDPLTIIPGISGATLMGDGNVSLILDISELIKAA